MTTVSLHTAVPILADAATLAKMSQTRPQVDRRSVSPKSTLPYRKLRVMIVDDNRINLSVLSTLLKRRFGDLLEGAPIAVDSALKAIQLLRTQVFDLILMDIQMPFLSGLDATLRIRAGEDGVLDANRGVHIVAVTTAIGGEPELAYRRAGMDGMIGKPVRFQDISAYLCPLSHEAFNAAPSVEALDIDDEQVMPPLPPAISRNGSERLFYLPDDSSVRAPPPDICHGSNFEQMLRAQTRASLRDSGAIAVARAGSWHASSSPSRGGKQILTRVSPTTRALQNANERIGEEEMSSDKSSSASGSRSNSSQELEPASWRQKKPESPKLEQQPKHVRTPSSTYSKRTLSLQIAREMERLADSSDLSDAGSGTHKALSAPSHVRPPAPHRISSPSCLATSPPRDHYIMPYVISPGADTSSYQVAIAKHCGNSATPDSGLSSEADDAQLESPHPTSRRATVWDFDRRDSQTSNGSYTSDVSTEASTPSSEHPFSAKDDHGRLRPVGGRPLHYFQRDRQCSRGVVEPWLDPEQSAAEGKKNDDLSLRATFRPRQLHVHASGCVAQLTEGLQKLDATN